jgi:hypothetical protein
VSVRHVAAVSHGSYRQSNSRSWSALCSVTASRSHLATVSAAAPQDWRCQRHQPRQDSSCQSMWVQILCVDGIPA